MFGIEKKNQILYNTEDFFSFLNEAGYLATKMPERELFGSRLQRIKLEGCASSPTICFDGGTITLLEMVALKREPTPMEMIEWNFRVNLMTFTYSPEGRAAILKGHVPYSHGITSKNFELHIEFWGRALAKFKNEMYPILLS